MVLIIRVSVKICDQYRLLFFLLSFLNLYFLSLSSFPHSLLPSILPFHFSPPFFFFFRVLAWELLWQKSVFLGFIFLWDKNIVFDAILSVPKDLQFLTTHVCFKLLFLWLASFSFYYILYWGFSNYFVPTIHSCYFWFTWILL